jgi:hypothetical protein
MFQFGNKLETIGNKKPIENNFILIKCGLQKGIQPIKIKHLIYL